MRTNECKMDEVWNICDKGHVTCLNYHSIQATAELPCICLYTTSKRHRGVEYFGLFLDSFIEERPEIFTRIAFSLIGSDDSEPNNEVEGPSQRWIGRTTLPFLFF